MTGRRHGVLLALLLSGCAAPAVAVRPPTVRPLPEYLPGDTVRISGRVQHDDTQLPVVGAIVVAECDCLPSDLELVTDAEGRYRFDGLPPGKYTIMVLHDIIAVNKSVDLGIGHAFRMNFSIPREPVCRLPVATESPTARADHSLLREDCVRRKGSPVGCRQEDNGRKRFVGSH